MFIDVIAVVVLGTCSYWGPVFEWIAGFCLGESIETSKAFFLSRVVKKKTYKSSTTILHVCG